MSDRRQNGLRVIEMQESIVFYPWFDLESGEKNQIIKYDSNHLCLPNQDTKWVDGKEFFQSFIH